MNKNQKNSEPKRDSNESEKKLQIINSNEIFYDEKHKQEDKELIKNPQIKKTDLAHGTFQDKVTRGLSNDESSIQGPDVEEPHFPDQ